MTMEVNTVLAASHTSASLYVGNLAPEVTEANLYEEFSKVGPVASIRVCRDAITRRSLNYAYINFFQLSDAERALDTLNYTLIKNRQCRIMWVQRDPSLRKSGVGNIFIKNLDRSIDTRQLHDTFSAFGNILSCKVVVDENGLSRGYGFVHYETAEAAEKAIAKLNGKHMNDKKVYVAHHVSRKERESKVEEKKKNFTNVFIKNLDESVEESELEVLFTKFGDVTSVIVAKDDQGNSKCFGFVNYRSHEAAAAACEELNDSEYKGKRLYVGRAQKRSERSEELRRKYEAMKQERHNKYQGVNLFVKNLDDTIDSERLRQQFSVFGTITSHKIVTDEKGNSKGFGFVCFSSPEEATKAVTDLNGHMLGSKPIYVALAQRKDVRRQQLAAQYQQRLLASQTGMLSSGIYNAPQMFYPPNVMQPPRNQNYYSLIRPPRWAPGQQQPGRPGFAAVPAVYAQNPAGGAGRPPRQNRGPRTGGVPPHTGAPTGPGSAIPPNGAPLRPMQTQMPQTVPAQTQQRGRANIRYTSNVRNNRADAAAAVPQVIEYNQQGALTAQHLADLAPEDQKNLLGERIYMQVQPQQPELASKITGMLLDLDSYELLGLLEDSAQLNAKVAEAIKVLEEHSKTQTEESA